MNSTIFLIETKSDWRWEELVRNAVTKLKRSVEIVSDKNISSSEYFNDSELVILDASYLGSLSTIISTIRSRNSNVRIIVFSPAPGWKEAKEVLLAGAVGYELKSSEEKDILRILEENLANSDSSIP
jgi:DNA-binding NarL/FixJ family response regulator